MVAIYKLLYSLHPSKPRLQTHFVQVLAIFLLGIPGSLIKLSFKALYLRLSLLHLFHPVQTPRLSTLSFALVKEATMAVRFVTC